MEALVLLGLFVVTVFAVKSATAPAPAPVKASTASPSLPSGPGGPAVTPPIEMPPPLETWTPDDVVDLGIPGVPDVFEAPGVPGAVLQPQQVPTIPGTPAMQLPSWVVTKNGYQYLATSMQARFEAATSNYGNADFHHDFPLPGETIVTASRGGGGQSLAEAVQDVATTKSVVMMKIAELYAMFELNTLPPVVEVLVSASPAAAKTGYDGVIIPNV